MQITIGKGIDFRKGETVLINNKAYFTVSYLDAGTCKLRPATQWEVLKFKVLMPWRRLKRWAIENREEI